MTVLSTIGQLRELFDGGAYGANRATLHCHSHFSDGVMAPTDIIDTAVRQGFHTVSLTDHDTTAAYLQPVPVAGSDVRDTLVAYAEARGVTLIPGIELSCWWRWHPVHILAYGIDPGDEGVLRLCAMTAKATSKRVKLQWWPVQAMSVCQLVFALGGVPVLAHPRFYWVNVRRMIAELRDLGGLVGVETEYEYRTHHLSLQCPVWTPQKITALAEQHHLIRTGGADAHGRDLTKYRR